MIGGRKIGIWGFVFSVVASYIGGAALVAYSAYVFRFGIPAMAVFAGTAAGFVLFISYALKLRKISSTAKFHTLPDWFYFHYGRSAGLLSSGILFLVYTGMLLNQFIAGSTLLSAISGWSYEFSLAVSGIVISVYLFAGGFQSVIKTDIFQYLVLLVVFMITAWLMAGHHDLYISGKLDFQDFSPGMTIAFLIFGVFIVFQSAEYWQRVYAARSDQVVKKGFLFSAILVLATGFAITMVGLNARHQLPGLDPGQAFAGGLGLILPENLTGVGLVMIFAAIMSSADTILFVLASGMAKDYVGRYRIRKGKSPDLMRITRWLTLVFSLGGVLLAIAFRDLIQVILFITGLGFSLIPATIASFHFKVTSGAVVASFVTGVIYVALLLLSGFLIPEYSIASFAVSTLTLIIWSLTTKKNSLSSD